MSLPVVVGITGASGAVYGRRLVEALLLAGVPLHLTISRSGQQVLEHELGVQLDLKKFQMSDLLGPGDWSSQDWTYHHFENYMSAIASGSFRTRGMVICPCSGSTLAGIAMSASGNLVQRAAEVHLKERRPLILVPRETPLSLIQLENMHKVSQAGAVILPAAPGFYHGAQTIADLVDFIVARILDQLAIPNRLIRRWGHAEPQE